MSPENNHHNDDTNALARIGSLVVFLGAALYFTGWIYRGTYFDFFYLKLFHLELPPQYLMMISLRVFFQNHIPTIQTVIFIFITPLLINYTFAFLDSKFHSEKSNTRVILRFLIEELYIAIKFIIYFIANPKIILFFWKKRLDIVNQKPSFIKIIVQEMLDVVNLINIFIKNIFPPQLLKEIIIVTWILIFLYWSAKIQGNIDAEKDAVKITSTLPSVTMVIPETKLKLDDNSDKLLILGGNEAFYRVAKKSSLNKNKQSNPQDLRLLLQNNDWIYLFEPLDSLASKEKLNVIAVAESQSGDQMLIVRQSQD